MKPSLEKHNVARLRVALNEFDQKQFADLIGCPLQRLRNIETGRTPLDETLARRIAAETDAHLGWLLDNDLEAEIVNACGRRYTRWDFADAQAAKHFIDYEFKRLIRGHYAVSFYGQIVAILSSAAKKGMAEVATWKIAKFLEDCRREFGQDRQLIGRTEQFGLRADGSPYLKHRQINAGIALFKQHLAAYKAFWELQEQVRPTKRKTHRRSRSRSR